MKILQQKRKSDARRPGVATRTSGKYAKIVALSFIGICAVALALQFFEIGVPGMAWYVYE